MSINNSTVNPNKNDGNVITTPSSTVSTVLPVKNIVNYFLFSFSKSWFQTLINLLSHKTFL